MAPLISPEVVASSSVEAASATVWDAAPLPAETSSLMCARM